MKPFCLLFLASFSAQAWVYTPDYFYNQPCTKVTDTLFLLHGTSRYGIIDTPAKLGPEMNYMMDELFKKCVLVVVPKAKHYSVNSEPMHVWDYTHQLSSGRDTTDLIYLIELAHSIFHKPVYILGASAGAFMAHRLSNELRLIGKDKLIKGIVMLDGASAYAVTSLDYSPWFEGAFNVPFYSILSHTYYVTDDSYLYMGFNKASVRSYYPTLIVYSKDDPYVLENVKRAFAGVYSHFNPDTQWYVSGTKHNVGYAGIDLVLEWLVRQPN